MTGGNRDARVAAGVGVEQEAGVQHHQDTPVGAAPQADLAAEINALHERAFSSAREALEHARRAGELLLEAKAAVGHGAWLPWVEANCRFSVRTAQGYMRLAGQWGKLQDKSATVAHLTLRESLDLLAETEEPRPALHPAGEIPTLPARIENIADPAADFHARMEAWSAEFNELMREARDFTAPLTRIGELLSDDHWDKVFAEAIALDLSRKYAARAELARLGLRITEKLIPKVGEMVFGESQGRVLNVAPAAELPGFYFVSVITNFDSGDAVVDGTARPVAMSAVGEAVKCAGFLADGAVLLRSKSAPWRENIWLSGGAA